ncbi:hypothetical protein [Actinomadura violacea]|uniref:Uncharacterized protein n=1 Tax=Actinomadura violacea TaxID=2819934 RepID=A0ABS3RKX9_9ACTN|nr:hypothetical protein [Actinomadura violacea]MBO2457322.1 hypothetical protein [Actinomadura violacea]
MTLLAEHDDAVTALRIVAWPGRRAVFSIARDGVARVTGLDDGAELCAWDVPAGGSWAMSGGPDPLLIGRATTSVSAYAPDGTLRWTRRAAPPTWTWLWTRLWCGAEAFACEEDGAYVVRATADGAPLGRPMHAQAMLTSSDGTALRALVPDGDAARLVDPVTGAEIGEVPWPEGTVPLGLAGPDDRWLLASGSESAPGGYLDWSPRRWWLSGSGDVRLWDRESGRWTAAGGAFAVTAGEFSRSLRIAGDWYALTGTGQEECRLLLWRLPGCEPAAELARTDLSIGRYRSPSRERAAVTDDARTLVIGGDDGRVVRVALPSDPAAMPAPRHEYHSEGGGYHGGSVAALGTEPPIAFFQTEHYESDHSWGLRLDTARPDWSSVLFDAHYGHTVSVPFARTGVMNGEPVAAVNAAHGFETWSPSGGYRRVRASVPAEDAVIGTCDHDRPALAAWFFDGLTVFHLDDGEVCEDALTRRADDGERLALVAGRPVVARLDPGVGIEYDALGTEGPEWGWIPLADDCPPGCAPECWGKWSIVHADDQGRVLVVQHGGAIHRYDLAAEAHLGAPVTGVRGTFHGARTGRLRDRDVVLVMAGTVLSVHDAMTGARLERIAAHTRVFDAATTGDGRIVAMTDNGGLIHTAQTPA